MVAKDRNGQIRLKLRMNRRPSGAGHLDLRFRESPIPADFDLGKNLVNSAQFVTD